MKAGSKVEFTDLEIGMKVRCERSSVEVITEGRITTLGVIGPQVVGFYLGDRRDTYTLLEDFNEPKLPEREGLVVASWRRDKNSFSPIAGDRVLGHWRQTTDGGWAFRPVMTRSPFWISPRRITAITEVTPVPDDALEILANLQHMSGVGMVTKGELEKFFRRVNEVQG